MPTVTVAKGGAFCKLTGECGPGGQGGNKAEIRGFSRQSRKRLIDLIHQVDRSAQNPPLFVTLTYPAEWPSDWKVYKRHLDSWIKRLRRRWPNASLIWRLEYQKRGAPHYHILLFGVRYVPASWLSRSWYEVVSSGDEKHLMAGTQVARVYTWRGAAFYCAKYLGKVCEYASMPTGRMWGVRGDLPIHLVGIDLSWRAFHRLRRVLRTFYEKNTGRRAWWTSQRGAGITAYIGEKTAARALAWAVSEVV